VKYSALTQHYFEATPGAGVLEGSDVFHGEAGARARGTWVRFDLKVQSSASGEKSIAAARFLAFGCPHVIAVAAFIAERATGLAVRPALPETLDVLRDRFQVPIEKLGRLFIVEDAWIAAARAAAA
jgi:NifU-like protein involved in Fe-S cluster formation